MGVGLRLKEILRNRKMSIKQLSEKSGISINTLYSITKRDSENIDPVIMRRIADTLGIHFSSLLSEEVLQEYYERNLDLVAVDIHQSMIDDAILNDDYDAYKKALSTRPEDIEEKLLDDIVRKKIQARLLVAYSKLNSEGQLRVIEYAEALVVAGKYTDNSNQ